jgi:MFS family permease
MTPLGSAYDRLWAASTTSNLGDGIVLVGAPLLVVQITREPAAVAGVQFAATLPWLLLALHVGAIADRRDRRRLMTAAALLRAAVLLGVGVAVALGWLSLPLLYLAVLAFGIGEVAFDTTSQSLVPDLVDHEQLGVANGRLIGAQTVMTNFVGAPLAGILATLAAASILLGPAVLYLAAALLLTRLPGRYLPLERPPAKLRRDIAEGLRYLRGQRALRSIAGIAGINNLASTAYFSVFVLFVVGEESPMGLPSIAYGVLGAALAAGSVAGSLLACRVEALLGPRRALLGGMLSLSALMLLPVITADVVVIAAMAVVLGLLGIVVNVVSVSSRQRVTPPVLLGRVNSAFRLVAAGSMPFGALLGGVVASAFGLRTLFVCAVGLQVLGVLAFHRPITDAALRPRQVPAQPTSQAS